MAAGDRRLMWKGTGRGPFASAVGYVRLIIKLHPCLETLVCVVLLIIFLGVDFCSLWQVI